MYSQPSGFLCRCSQLPLPWCTPGPLLPDELLALCCLIYSQLSAAWWNPGPLLPDELLALCCLMYSRPSAAWCNPGPLLPDELLALCCLIYSRPSAFWCTPSPLLPVARSTSGSRRPGVHQAAEGREYIRQWKLGVPTSEGRSLGVHQAVEARSTYIRKQKPGSTSGSRCIL